jgi:hypothetical protein
MTKRQIPYNNSAATLRFEFPPNWVAQTITAVNIQITDLDGADLLAETATTLWTATTLASAASVGDPTVTLTAGTLSPGDRLQIAASATGPQESIETQHYNSSSKVVKGLFCTYDLDTSTVATWVKTKQLLIKWIPVGSDDLPYHEEAEVAVSQLAMADFERRFRFDFPREADIVARKGPLSFQKHHENTLKELGARLGNRGALMNRLQDQASSEDLILALARFKVTRAAGDKWTYENGVAEKEYERQFEIFAADPKWFDDDQDGVRDAAEIDDHSVGQRIGSERCI